MNCCELQVIHLNQDQKWDEIVRSFKDADIYYLSGYVKSFQLHGDGEPLLFFAKSGDTKGINVVMKRDVSTDPFFRSRIRPGTCFDLATPYGYGGWLIEGQDTADIFAAHAGWCRENNVISEFVRFHPVLQNHTNCEEAYDICQLGETIAMDLSSPETIWSGITSKNRNMIRKAMKHGVTIKEGFSEELLSSFRVIYNETMDRHEATKYYYFDKEFYDSMLENIAGNSRIFYAVTPDDTIISSAIILGANGRLNYHLAGTRSGFSDYAANNLLLYQVALWGCENGYQTFHLGGGVGSLHDSLFRFKRSFARNGILPYFVGRKIYQEETYQKLTMMKELAVSTNFFPAYRS